MKMKVMYLKTLNHLILYLKGDVLMKISNFFNKINLHDSLVNIINYNKNNRQLTLTIELSNWNQPGFNEGENEIIDGEIIL